ncbi:YcaO-like family protein, partial [Vibrio cholerae]|uniref:YcaO-like family protein n=1 Tax=Vibrio cholerae TaxID=666 RepID=UPI0034570E83
VRVWNSKRRVRIPRSLIYLNSNNELYSHFRDSSGCALGPNPQNAKIAACLEFIERQSLIISWHTKVYQCKVASSDLLNLCDSMRRRLCERFLDSGEIIVLLNTVPGVSCYSGIMLYRSKLDVKYAVSSGCALSLSSLINKLIGELWQSYLFIYNNVNGNNVTERDYYKANFLNMNHYQTVDLWGASESELPIAEIECCKPYNEEDFYRSLTKLNARLYLYESETQDNFYFCKLISPDFFLHMSAFHTKSIPQYCRDNFNIRALRDLELPFP